LTKFGQFAAIALLAIPGFAHAFERIRIRDNEVIPVKFDDSISTKTSRRGDRVSATVEGDKYLPEGTKLVGIIREIKKKDGGDKGFAELEFTAIQLPNGRRVDIRAYPIPLGDKYVSKDRDGRMEAKKGTRRENVVLGGAAGGLILGSIFRKPLEGAIIGVLGGILVAETDAMNTSGEKIVDKGQKMGAAFDRAIAFDYDPRDDREDAYDGRSRDQDRDGNRDRDLDRDDLGNRDSLKIEYRDRTIRFEDSSIPFRDGSTVMVPLLSMADELGLEVTKSGSQSYYLEDEENMLKLERNSSSYRLNGKRFDLPKEVVERNGILFVPIDLFAAIKEDAIYVNGTRIANRS